MRNWIDLFESVTIEESAGATGLQQACRKIANSIAKGRNLAEWPRTAFRALCTIFPGLDSNDIDFVEENYEDVRDLIRGNPKQFVNAFYNQLIQDSKNLEKLFSSGSVRLYRIMGVKPDYVENLKSSQSLKLGIYWAYDPAIMDTFLQFSATHSGDCTSDVILQCDAPISAVDWDGAIAVYVELNDFEKEIRLHAGAAITLVSVKFDGQEIDISDITKQVTA